MIREEEGALLRGYLDIGARLARGFDAAVARAAPMMPMDAGRIDTLTIEEEDIILAYLKRFEQFEDALHRTLKLISRAMEHGRIERLTSVDVTRRAHALGIVDDPRVWEGAVRARNALAHEYPLNPARRAEQVNLAWAQTAVLTQTHGAIERFVDVEGLLA